MMNMLFRGNYLKHRLLNKSAPHEKILRTHHNDLKSFSFANNTINYQNIPKKLTIPKNISLELFEIINNESNDVYSKHHTYDTYDTPNQRESPW